MSAMSEVEGEDQTANSAALDTVAPADVTLPAPAAEAAPRPPSTPIDVRSVSLALLAVLASVFVLHWAAAVFVPLLLGLCSAMR